MLETRQLLPSHRGEGDEKIDELFRAQNPKYSGDGNPSPRISYVQVQKQLNGGDTPTNTLDPSEKAAPERFRRNY
jgi:hypothetical protein